MVTKLTAKLVILLICSYISNNEKKRGKAKGIFEQTKPKSKSKMPKLLIFQVTKTNFAAVGISEKLMDQQYSFNYKILLGPFNQ